MSHGSSHSERALTDLQDYRDYSPSESAFNYRILDSIQRGQTNHNLMILGSGEDPILTTALIMEGSILGHGNLTRTGISPSN